MLRIHVVPHTHWDREWYHPAARFRVRLGRMLAALLAAPVPPAFLLDGQAVILDDFLAFYPDRRTALAAALAAGRFECGPWYVLPDELTVSAESLVRNLQEGARTVRRAGGEPLGVGYSPDAFGHSGMLPSLLCGFGIPVAVAWRGLGGDGGVDSDMYRWKSPDGSEVLLVHLPPPGYEYGADLPTEAGAARARWAALRTLLEARARTAHWLVLNGADHHAPQAGWDEALRALREAAGGARVEAGGMGAYASAVLAATAGLAVPAVHGELREGRRHAWALQGTFASRVGLKQENARAQRRLERYAEPLAALAGRAGADLRPALQHAWRLLLQNHAHDSICGTSADAVHREMETRFASCRAVSDEIIDGAIDTVIRHDRDAGRRAGRPAWRPGIVLFNPAPEARLAVVVADVPRFLADVPVGPGSRPPRGRVATPGPFRLVDAAGTALPFQVLGRRRTVDLVEAPRHYPDADAVEIVTVAVRAAVSPLSATVLAVEEARPPAFDADPGAVTVSGATLGNAALVVRVEDAGTLEVVDRSSGEHYRGLAALEDVADAGDSYTSAPRGRPAVPMPSSVAVRVVHGGPLRGTLEVVRRFDALDLVVTMAVTLDAGAGAVAIRLEGVNRRPDHRVRLRFPSGTRARRVVADGHFGPVERGVGRARARRRDETEATPATAPMQGRVTLTGARRGLTVATEGLQEYEARADGTILVTLLRAFGQLSRPDLRERPGHAGWPVPTPDAQCLGPFSAWVAVQPHGPAALDDRRSLERETDRALIPVFARPLRSLLSRPASVPGPALVGDGLVFSAMKPADDGAGIILRCFNGHARDVAGSWLLPWPVQSASLCRFDESAVRSLPVEAGAVSFVAGPRAVVTMRVV